MVLKSLCKRLAYPNSRDTAKYCFLRAPGTLGLQNSCAWRNCVSLTSGRHLPLVPSSALSPRNCSAPLLLLARLGLNFQLPHTWAVPSSRPPSGASLFPFSTALYHIYVESAVFGALPTHTCSEHLSLGGPRLAVNTDLVRVRREGPALGFLS